MMNPPFSSVDRRALLALGVGGLTLGLSPAFAQTSDGAKPKIATIGAGRQGGALGTLFAKAGYQVMFSALDPDALAGGERDFVSINRAALLRPLMWMGGLHAALLVQSSQMLSSSDVTPSKMHGENEFSVAGSFDSLFLMCAASAASDRLLSLSVSTAAVCLSCCACGSARWRSSVQIAQAGHLWLFSLLPDFDVRVGPPLRFAQREHRARFHHPARRVARVCV